MFVFCFRLQTNIVDVAAEKAFWTAAGFTIFNESEMMGYETFDMKSHPEATTTITVYANEFIHQVSPEVIDMKPSLLFETDDIDGLQARIAGLTDTCSSVNAEPFPNFNFASPSGHYFAVKG
ncbi:TPA: glyoxalase [Streptococcus suis]|nr:glyoxalase [Streptococcus suis]NQJ19912.1 glyoxalase [Streptococcus suis]NQK55799.1 glyoxalase [Streptococcus suis]NQK57195.1 glyoxalase [Streptococcus suis]NQM48748.1 glyoxalase [Streptococcus suis]